MSDPIFKSIFGEQWDRLPPVMHAHYANRPFTDDRTAVEGELSVVTRAPMRWLSVPLWLFGMIPPANEANVRARVDFVSEPDSTAFRFERVFYFKGRKPYRFKSRMLQLKGNEVAEITRTGICWLMTVLWEDGKVILRHRGYALHIFGRFVPLPLTLLLGRCDAEETPLSAQEFSMRVTILHPLWGEVYGYSGRFKLVPNE